MKGFVYAITSENGTIIYVGSSKQRLLCMRKGDHTKQKKGDKGWRPLHSYIEENGGWTKFSFKVLEEVEFDDPIRLRERERHHYDLYTPIMNLHRPFTTLEERKEARREDAKRFRVAHPDYEKRYETQKKEYAKKRCATVIECSCGKTYKKQNKTNHFKTKYHIEHS